MMLIRVLNQSKYYLLNHPELEQSLPISYVNAFKAYDDNQIETIKPLIMSLFNDAYENHEGGLVFFNQENYSSYPDFSPLCSHLINDNDEFSILSICHRNFPNEFERFIIPILTHPCKMDIISDVFQQEKNNAFSGENALLHWQDLVAHDKNEKRGRILNDFFLAFLTKKDFLEAFEICPLPSYEIPSFIKTILSNEELVTFNRYLNGVEQEVVINIIWTLDTLDFFNTSEHCELFSSFISLMRIDRFGKINDFFETNCTTNFNQVLQKAIELLLENPGYIDELVNILNHLSILEILTDNNLERLKNQQHLDTISDLFNALTTTGIMDSHNAEDLFIGFIPYLYQIANSDALTLLMFGLANEHDFEVEDWHEILNLINHQTPENLIQNFVDNILNPPIHENTSFNPPQSTHTRSVHETSSRTAISFKKKYNIDNHEKIFSEISDYLQSFDQSNWKVEAAYRAFKAISQGQFDFEDTPSQTTLKEFILLSWVAIHDDELRIGGLDVVLKNWVEEGLCKIQRGYNESDCSFLSDNPICLGGAFNKINESIAGCHQLVTFKYITMLSFGLKLNASIQTLMHQYLKMHASPINLEQFFKFNHIVQDIKLHGIEQYWPFMRDYLKLKLFHEFKSLFFGIHDSNFHDTIESGKDIEIKNLTKHQREIGTSIGYQKFCRMTLFSNPKILEKNQHEFDKRYGLIKM